MLPETQKLLTTLETIVKNLTSGGSGIGSEGDHPFRPLIWSISEQGEFSFVKLIEASRLLTEISLDELIEVWRNRFIRPGRYSEASSNRMISQALPKYHSLIEILQTELEELRFFKIQTYNEKSGKAGSDGFRGYDLLGLIVGQTTTGDWVAFTQKVELPDSAGFGERLPRYNYPVSEELSSLSEQIKPILEDSASLIVFKASLREDWAIEEVLRSIRFLEIYSFRGVFDVEQGAGYPYEYTNFEEFIATHLKDTRVYVLGNDALYRLYIIGKCTTGDWLGALTLAVWT
ncbi:hypothetical protein RIVM261_086320 [Rivularia sp. IAM M-261]|nr:hypothetical protein RIVM261_086320 [Rivularia sp. IAM M-261]